MNRKKVRTAILFDNFGPYHLARLNSAAAMSDLLAVEFAVKSGDYEWRSGSNDFLRREIIEADGKSGELATGEFRRRLRIALGNFKPQAIAIPGWASRGALLSLEWGVRNGVPVIVMSESTAWDERRVGWKEWTKWKIIGLAAAALVGGNPHRDYLVKLGLSADRIFFGYDAVDNAYFARASAEARSREVVESRYFLASNRFIEKKNLFRLLQAFGSYVLQCRKLRKPVWPLVMLGNGELRPKLFEECRKLGLSVMEGAPWEAAESEDSRQSETARVYFPGFRQIEELPRFYAHAAAFIHASTTEQWGLVVNEAMASGLPVIVSNRCGCARDLVEEGINGFSFDPLDVDALAGVMMKVSKFSWTELDAFGEASRKIVSRWGPDRFAEGLKAAAEKAIAIGPIKSSMIQRLILRLLLAR